MNKLSGLAGRPVTITEHAGKLPFTILLAPDHGEVSQALAHSTRKLAETVRALSNGAKTLDWINLQGSGPQRLRIDNSLENNQKSSTSIFIVWKNKLALPFGGRALYFCAP